MASQRKGAQEELQTVTFESQALSTIALLLRSTEDEIVLKSLGSIMKFVEKSDKNKAEAKSVGILEILVPHLRHSNSSIVKYACMNCGLLASLVDIRVELRRLDVIPILLDILSDSDLYEMLIIEYATLTLSSMSIDYHGRNIIMKLNGIPLIAKFLLVRDPDVQKNSVEIFSNLLQNVNAVKNLCDVGGILSLFLLLKSEFEVIQQLTFLCLVRATSKRRERVNFVDSSGLTVLMQILENKAQSEFHVDCLRVLNNCLEDPECEQYLCNNGLLALSIDVIKKTEKFEVKIWTLKVLYKLFKNTKNLKLVQNEEIERLLIGFLNSQVPAIQSASTEIIALLAHQRRWRDTLKEAGAIERLVHLLTNNDDFVRLSATVALANMTFTSYKNCNEVRDCKALNILAEFLYIPNFELQAAAAACLTNVAIVREAREDAMRANVIPGFINCLQSRDIIVQLNTCTAIAAYIGDNEARSQFLQHGIASLVKLLSLSKSEIYLKTLWIISTIGVYNDVAVALCEHGIVHLLSQHTKWQNRGNYADLVLERIFSTHLPAKYGYTGYLAPTDHISELFYDVGSWPWENKFPSLENFSVAPINPKPAILLVNFQQQTTIFSISSDDDTPSDVSSSTSIAFRTTRDPMLIECLEEVVETILPMSSIHHRVNALAKLVSDKMGGKFGIDSIHTYSPELEISYLKCKYTSNVLPIGSLTKSLFRSRALLFKAMADHIGIPCSLVRGTLRRVWNEVLLPPKRQSSDKERLTEKYIIDLIFNPGQLLPIGSIDANQYCDIRSSYISKL
uniref:Armadillo repeat-containing protein 3 n=1 Tax=Strigamia maritima TaxID=126957 RepID=T1IY27_STRMM